ncbi:MAG TPA: SGNH/GDSL hydrolase family protein [Burkholderiales bacterium]|nr:SGNH/GDSL hydrolase family protein [Burkholderiales bacterium]
MKATAVAATAVAVLAAALVALEVALRVIGYSAPQWYQLDPRLGWSLRAHRHGVHVQDGVRAPVHINTAGFRDRDRFLDKLEGVYRIAVLGDEISEAMQVPVNEAWWWRLPALLKACTSERRVEVLNFAVGGYGTGQELVVLESTAMRYQPDLVLLQFSSRNDVADNSFALARDKLRPFYRLDGRGVPHISESFASSPRFEREMQTRYRLGAEIADHSRAFQLARQFAGIAFIGEAHAERDVSAPPELWEEAWRITDALLARMNDYSQRNGARFMIAVDRPDQRLAAFGERAHVPVVSLAESLPRFPSGQWTAEGHRLAAEAIAKQLCNRGQSPI